MPRPCRYAPFSSFPLWCVWLLLVVLAPSACVYARVMYYGVPGLQTREHFDHRAVAASRHPVPLGEGRELQALLLPPERERYRTLDGLLAANETRAFLALSHDAIVYERYFGGVSRETLMPSFSISKTYAALLVGVAESEGVLGPLSDSIVTYVPELSNVPSYDQVTLEHLLRMTSGIDYVEQSVNGAKVYYSSNLRDQMYAYGVRWRPGTHYEYGSINVQLLWDALHRRLGGQTVSEYFEKKVWEPLGADRAAEWSLDSESSGIEKFFGGFNATARDHARLGLLFLHGGSLNGRQVVPEPWALRSLVPDPVAGVYKTSDGPVRHSPYQWFLTLDGRCYFAKGYHGQYIFVVPDRSAVFVRFGEGYGSVDWPALFVRLAEQMT